VRFIRYNVQTLELIEGKGYTVDIALKVGITPQYPRFFSNHPRISTLTRDEVFKTAKAVGEQGSV
jgi:hypothetical protein